MLMICTTPEIARNQYNETDTYIVLKYKEKKRDDGVEGITKTCKEKQAHQMIQHRLVQGTELGSATL